MVGRKISVLDQVVFVIFIFCVTIYVQSPKENDLLRDKRVLLTGACRGVGEHLAYNAAKSGARLVIADLDAGRLEKVAKKCEKLGATDVTMVPGDVTTSHGQMQLLAEIQYHLKGMDFLILNHGNVSSNQWNGSSSAYMADLRNTMDTNFMSYVQLTSTLVPLLEQSQGHIAVVVPQANELGTVGRSSYTAAVQALRGFFASNGREMEMRNNGVSITFVDIGDVDYASKDAYFSFFNLNIETAVDMIVRNVLARDKVADISLKGHLMSWCTMLLPFYKL